ncbi:hypothetical protein [Streptococcus uberis]|uniref:hypothetical protein n=1 Tax=Streptococcus uberis TaxID=1349 RepID=UPI001FF4519D|nr:hypothetical protein [Streptococcus uberis]MCK1223180.1 hypothetical protein [Streptococcus uberis]
MNWIFDGIGTTIFTLIIGGAVGGRIGYKIGITKNIKQTQKTGDNSNLSQIGEINVNK